MGRIRRIRRLFHRRLRRLFHRRLFHGRLRRLFHAYLICSYLICSDLICCSYVVFNAYGASSNVVHAIIPTTINHLREEVFERGGEAKEEKEGIKEDQQEEGQQEEGQQEEKVSNEPFNRWTCMCTDYLLGKWHLCILVTVPLRLCCDPKCMVRIRSVTCIFIILL